MAPCCKSKADLPVTKITKARKKPKKKRVEDVHCVQCGRTQHKQDPEKWHHRCRPHLPIVYQDARSAICAKCEHNENGVCQIILDPERNRPGVISVGVAMPKIGCPVGRWHPVARDCPECKAYNHDGVRLPRRCRYCSWSAFKPAQGTIGFLGPAYLEIGGTETWHRSLLPHLEHVTGYGIVNSDLATGNEDMLGVPLGMGLDECRQLAAASETLVVWGLGRELESILKGMPRKRVISVAHCDARSEWMRRVMHEQARFAKEAVYIEASGWDVIPETQKTRAVLIPNGVDVDRLATGKTRFAARDELGIKPSEKVLLVLSRIAEEKRIDKLAECVEALPEHYRLLVVGKAQEQNQGHLATFAWRSRVTVLPPTDQPGDVFAAADALVSASDFEGCGLSMVEAAISGLPLIATPVGAATSAPGLFCELPIGETAKCWAERIKNDFAMPGHQKQRTARAKQFFSRRYSHALFVERWKRFLSC